MCSYLCTHQMKVTTNSFLILFLVTILSNQAGALSDDTDNCVTHVNCMRAALQLPLLESDPYLDEISKLRAHNKGDGYLKWPMLTNILMARDCDDIVPELETNPGFLFRAATYNSNYLLWGCYRKPTALVERMGYFYYCTISPLETEDRRKREVMDIPQYYQKYCAGRKTKVGRRYPPWRRELEYDY